MKRTTKATRYDRDVGWYYRKRKGGLNLSLSRRGPRVSFGVGPRGCLLWVAAGACIVFALTAR